jgi:UDP-N-acetylglucosamine--N-acetylmuramyl-(pentapeptide) pyrophosphoryl-undecaprenol N-acetylglucosamine transferase
VQPVMSGQLDAPPEKLEILCATGPTQLDSMRVRLKDLELPWLHVHGYIDAMPEALAATDVAVSRAGAMATAELLAWGRPTLLVPLPTAAADHQTHNARALEQAGAAIMLREQDLTPARLWADVLALTADPVRREAMAAAAKARAQPHAARRIAEQLHALIES